MNVITYRDELPPTVGAFGRLGLIIIVAIISLIQPVISSIYTPQAVDVTAD